MSHQSVIIDRLKQIGAFLTEDHFVYTSGKHGDSYVNKDAIFSDFIETSDFCEEIVFKLSKAKVIAINTVIGPATGGIIVSYMTAMRLGSRVHPVYAEKEIVSIDDPEGKGRTCYAETGNFVINRGYKKFVRGKNVLVVEDVLTTGGTVKKLIQAVQEAGGTIIGLGAFCNRGGVTATALGIPNVPIVSVVDIGLTVWDEAECPLCKQGILVNTTVGKGAEFFARKQKMAP